MTSKSVPSTGDDAGVVIDIDAPWPSIIPVILLSSNGSPAVPTGFVLTFLPIGNSLFVLDPVPSILTLSFLG